jgi:23S rRNA pseudouridine2457 synthase
MTARVGGPGRIVILNKPYGVLSKFSDRQERPTLKGLIDISGIYPVGRLDADSEGLLILTDRASLVQPLLAPGGKEKTYLVCVEGVVTEEALARLRAGVMLKDGPTLPARASAVEEPSWLWPRNPPIRYRRLIPTSWLELTVREGRNRQVRRMTAAVGLPTLRLVRVGFGPVSLGALPDGAWRDATPAERQALLAWEEEYLRSTRSRPAPKRAGMQGRGKPAGQRGSKAVFPKGGSPTRPGHSKARRRSGPRN